MQDAVYTPALSASYAAFGSYTDGSYPTASYVIGHFPDAYHLFLTTGLGPADGIDVEPGNVGWNDGCAAVPGWVKWRLAAGVARPAIYISSSSAGFIVTMLANNGIARSSFRLFTAHWTGVPHLCTDVCAPGTGIWTADATQFAGNVGGDEFGYDLSLCADDFFATAPIAAPAVVPIPTATPTPTDLSEEDDEMFLIETKGASVKARKLTPGKYPAVQPKACFIVTAAGKRTINSNNELAMWVSILPADRQFLNARARDCIELADTPSL